MHSSPHPCRDALTALLLLLVLCLPATAVRAQESGLAIETAGSALIDGTHVVSATIDYRLSREALSALQNGVPLTFEVRVELAKPRRWWLDASIVAKKRVSNLSYDALSRTYVIKGDLAEDQQSFRTLYAALNALGRVEKWPLVEDARLEPGEEYEAGIMAVLDQQRLPGPLRLLAFWQDGLDLESEWYRWTLVR